MFTYKKCKIFNIKNLAQNVQKIFRQFKYYRLELFKA